MAKVEYKGKEYPSMKKLCELKSVTTEMVTLRMKKGMSLEEAIDTPKKNASERNPLIATADKTCRKPVPVGVRAAVARSLFEIFAEHGMVAFEEAVKREVKNADTVLPFFKTYLMPLIPKEALQALDGEKASMQSTHMHINVDGAYIPPNIIDVTPL